MQHLRGDVKICLSELTLVMEYLRQSNKSKAWMCWGDARYYSRLALVQLEGLVKDASTAHDECIEESKKAELSGLRSEVQSLGSTVRAMHSNVETVLRRVNILEEYRLQSDRRFGDAPPSDGEGQK